MHPVRGCDPWSAGRLLPLPTAGMLCHTTQLPGLLSTASQFWPAWTALRVMASQHLTSSKACTPYSRHYQRTCVLVLPVNQACHAGLCWSQARTQRRRLTFCLLHAGQPAGCCCAHPGAACPPTSQQMHCLPEVCLRPDQCAGCCCSCPGDAQSPATRKQLTAARASNHPLSARCPWPERPQTEESTGTKCPDVASGHMARRDTLVVPIQTDAAQPDFLSPQHMDKGPSRCTVPPTKPMLSCRVGPAHHMARRDTLLVPMRTDAGLPDFELWPQDLDKGLHSA